MIEVCAGVEPVAQPSPARNPGGDCFACALAAGLRHLFPDRAPSLNTAWDFFRDDRGVLSNTWPGFWHALGRAEMAGLATERTRDRVQPRALEIETWSYPWALEIDEGEYVRRLEGYLRGGWIAATEIRHEGGGPYTQEGLRRPTNHFVLIDGVRYGWEREGGFGSLRHYVRVVCSAKGAYWIDADLFLRQHGGAGWILFRRDIR